MSKTFAPGLYHWDTAVDVTTDISVSGTLLDSTSSFPISIPALPLTPSLPTHPAWIFQITGELTVATGVKLTLSGGALASNIVWVVAADTTLGAGVQWEGVILDETAIHLETNATVTGRLLAGTAVTLQSSTVDAGVVGGLGLRSKKARRAVVLV